MANNHWSEHAVWWFERECRLTETKAHTIHEGEYRFDGDRGTFSLWLGAQGDFEFCVKRPHAHEGGYQSIIVDIGDPGFRTIGCGKNHPHK